MDDFVNDFWVERFYDGQIFKFQFAERAKGKHEKDFYLKMTLDLKSFKNVDSLVQGEWLRKEIENRCRKLRETKAELPRDSIGIFPEIILATYIIGDLVRLSLEKNPWPKPIYDSKADETRWFKHVFGCKLSETIGQARCLEQAILGQYLMQHALSPPLVSTYAAGFVVQDAVEVPERGHAFLLIDNKSEEKRIVWDIANPIKVHTESETWLMERILHCLDYKSKDLISNQQRYMVIPSKDTLNGDLVFYGVGPSRLDFRSNWNEDILPEIDAYKSTYRGNIAAYSEILQNS